MAVYKCLVNGEIGTDLRRALTDGLARIEGEHFGEIRDAPEVEFIEVEAGTWYTAGELSQSSMVLGSVPAGTSEDVRAAVMGEIAEFYAETTGAELDHVMVVAPDMAES